MKLSQHLAMEKTKRTAGESAFTAIYQALDKKELFQGLSRTYKRKHEEGEDFPPERKHVQARVEDQFRKVKEILAELFDLAAYKAASNCVARANIIVDGEIMVKDCPVTHLLELEHKLENLATFVRKLPVLDPGHEWVTDGNTGMWRTAPTPTIRTKKEPRVVELSKATDKHQAQVQLLQEDVAVGIWETTHMSGALPATAVEELIRRVEKCQAAVKIAREQGNMVEVVELKSSPLLHYIFAPLPKPAK